jgi:hypothetical protein
VLPVLVEEGRRFDAVFFDTYAEHYTHMQVRFNAVIDGSIS